MHASFFIPCLPPKATSQMKGACRVGNGIRFFKKANVAAAERDLVSLLTAHRPADYSAIESGPVHVSVLFVWPYRKSEPKRRTTDGALLDCDTRPDVDNLAKLLLDAMTRCGFWRDDGQVSDLRIAKLWGPDPGISIRIDSPTSRVEAKQEGGAR